MHPILSVAERRGRALADRDWDAVAAQLHPAFRYVNANGQGLDREGYLAFLADGPVRWTAQTLVDAEVAADGPVAVLVATVVDDVLFDGGPTRWEFVTSQTYVRQGGAWLYLAGPNGAARALEAVQLLRKSRNASSSPVRNSGERSAALIVPATRIVASICWR